MCGPAINTCQLILLTFIVTAHITETCKVSSKQYAANELLNHSCMLTNHQISVYLLLHTHD